VRVCGCVSACVKAHVLRNMTTKAHIEKEGVYARQRAKERESESETVRVYVYV